MLTNFLKTCKRFSTLKRLHLSMNNSHNLETTTPLPRVEDPKTETGESTTEAIQEALYALIKKCLEENSTLTRWQTRLVKKIQESEDNAVEKNALALNIAVERGEKEKFYKLAKQMNNKNQKIEPVLQIPFKVGEIGFTVVQDGLNNRWITRHDENMTWRSESSGYVFSGGSIPDKESRH